MQIRIERLHSEAVMVRLHGALDFESVGAVRRVLVDLANRKVRWLIWNLSEVDFVDSAGLGLFLASRRVMGQHRVALLGVNALIHRILILTGLIHAVPVHANLHALQESPDWSWLGACKPLAVQSPSSVAVPG